MKKSSNLKSLDQFLDEQYGEKGTARRDQLEKGYEAYNWASCFNKPGSKKG